MQLVQPGVCGCVIAAPKEGALVMREVGAAGSHDAMARLLHFY